MPKLRRPEYVGFAALANSGYLLNTNVAFRTEKQSSPENTSHAVLPSELSHLAGKLHDSPGPTSHKFVWSTVDHGPQGSGAS